MGTPLRGVLLLLGLAGPLAAQATGQETPGSIVGTVVDATTGAPLVAAQVQLVELHRGDLTHDDGRFEFANVVPPGRYTLVVRRIGYQQTQQTVDVRAGETAAVEFTMRPAAVALAPTVVTGTIGAVERDEALRPTAVLSDEALDRRLEATVAATLEREPGLASTSSGPATARPVIRGLGGDRILVLEDGARAGDLSASSPDHAVAVDPLVAERLEVVRGPAALLYGSNALGGVVNVIRDEVPTALPDRVHGVAVAQGQTVNSGAAVGAMVESAVGRVALRGEASGRWAGNLETPVRELANSGLTTYSASAGLGWIPEWGHAGVAYRHYRSEYGIPPDPRGHEFGVDIEMRRDVVRGEAEMHDGVGPLSSLRASGGYTRYHHRELEPGGVLGTEYGLITAQGDLIARHGARGPLAEGAVGSRVQYEDFAAGGSQGAPPARSLSLAGFLLEEAERGPWRLQAGVRYDWARVEPLDTTTGLDIGRVRTRTFAALSGSVGALVEVAPGVRFGGSIARAFRTPGIVELFSQGPHLAAYSYDIGDPDLEAETGVGADVFARVSREHVQMEVAAFRNVIDDYIFPRETGDTARTGDPIYQYSNADAVLVGAEGRLAWEPWRRWAIEGTASYVRGTNSTTDRPLPFIPPLRGTLDVRYDTPRWFASVGARAAAEQARLGQFEEPTDGYAVLHGSAGYRWISGAMLHAVTLRLDNITDAVYRDHLSRIKALVPEPGRSVSLVYRLTY